MYSGFSSIPTQSISNQLQTWATVSEPRILFQPKTPRTALEPNRLLGSKGYPCVVIPLHTQHSMMLKRNLLYTAITRAKKLVVLVGTKKALAMAVRRQDTPTEVHRLEETA